MMHMKRNQLNKQKWREHNNHVLIKLNDLHKKRKKESNEKNNETKV